MSAENSSQSLDGEEIGLSFEEDNHLVCSTKKQKAGSSYFCPHQSIRSYKDSVIQPNNDWEDHSFPSMHVDNNDSKLDIDLNNNKTFPVILLSSKDKKCIRAPWYSALIIKAFGESLGFKFLNYKIRIIWKLEGNLQVIDLGLDYFLVRFQLKNNYWKVINEGP